MNLSKIIYPSLKWLGFALSMLSVAFVALKFESLSGNVDWPNFSSNLWAIGTLALIYCISLVFLAISWKFLLSFLKLNINFRTAISIYGVSQLAKYIPGNIFQFLGRQVLGQAADLKGWPVAKSAIWEIAILGVSGAFFSLLLKPTQ